MASKFNARSPSVKRIQQEMREFSRDPSPDMVAEALEENIFEWHFVVRGAADSEFEGGLYHGRILLPAEYPFKPPAFLMLTPNGRFETGQKVCLSISSHHPEHWQPSWSVRTALVALVAFMQTPGQGAIASLDFSKDDRRQLALQSRVGPPTFGGPARQDITNAAHATMLKREAEAQGGAAADISPALPQPSQPQLTQAACDTATNSPAKNSEAADCTLAANDKSSSHSAANSDRGAPPCNESEQSPGSGSQSLQRPALQASETGAVSQLSDMPSGTAEASLATEIQAASPPLRGGQPGSRSMDQLAEAQAERPSASPFHIQEQMQQAQHADCGRSSGLSQQTQQAGRGWEEAGLTAAAIAIVVLIVALLVKKVSLTAREASY